MATTHRAVHATRQKGAWWRARRLSVSAIVGLGLGVLGLGWSLGTGLPGSLPAVSADGPTACSVGSPPQPGIGLCATYDGVNTWFGAYGPGFPGYLGWVFCAGTAGAGGDYPDTAYDYQPGSPPAGIAASSFGDLGFTFSQAAAVGIWGGETGRFTADQAGVAGKLLYDAEAWGTPFPAVDPGTQAALDALTSWYTQAAGLTGSPDLSAAISTGSTIAATGASATLTATYPGSDNPVVGLSVTVTVTGGTLVAPTGHAGATTSTTLTTASSGQASLSVYPSGTDPVTVSAQAGVGTPGLDFYSPTTADLNAQIGVVTLAPATISASATATPPATGTVSVHKAGDDQVYLGVGGAVFQVVSGSGHVVALLTTNASGATGQSGALPAGATYRVHELTAPPGYRTAPDQKVTIVAGKNTVVLYTGAEEDHAIPGDITIRKVAESSGAPLAGAVFDVRFDPQGTGTYPDDLGTCTTSQTGTCQPPGNDSGGMLPGHYEVMETTAPPGYLLQTQNTVQYLDVRAGATGDLTFRDPLVPQVAVRVHKVSTTDPSKVLAGAEFDLYRMDNGQGPAQAAPPSGTPTLQGGTWVAKSTTGADGDATFPLQQPGYRYCVVEQRAPSGYERGTQPRCTGTLDTTDGTTTVTLTAKDRPSPTPTPPTTTVPPTTVPPKKVPPTTVPPTTVPPPTVPPPTVPPTTVPARPVPPTTVVPTPPLAFTGGPASWLVPVGCALLAAGGAIWSLSRRKRTEQPAAGRRSGRTRRRTAPRELTLRGPTKTPPGATARG